MFCNGKWCAEVFMLGKKVTVHHQSRKKGKFCVLPQWDPVTDDLRNDCHCHCDCHCKRFKDPNPTEDTQDTQELNYLKENYINKAAQNFKILTICCFLGNLTFRESQLMLK